MSSIHSLLGLPLLLGPSMIPNTTFFTNWLSSILRMCPNNFSFHSIIICATFFMMSSLHLFSEFVIFCCQCMWRIIQYHFMSNAFSESVSLFLRVQVSHAFSSTLITPVLIMPSLVRVLICILFHTFLNLAIAPVARAILLLISLLQSLSQVSWLPGYTNSVTFSICVLPIISSSMMFSSPNTIVMVV